MNYLNVIQVPIMCLILLSISGCPIKERWSGYIYTDKENLTHSKFIGEFSSLEECRNTAITELKTIHALTAGDYECGLNCEDGVCKETSN
ncbi:MAG: hypothetical protein K2X50_09020 [Gammaproteobacteria bacterium]|nr:hypothetical protein [Gammaproteobacteria bacterium]